MTEQSNKSLQERLGAVIDYYLSHNPSISEVATDEFFDYVDPRDDLSEDEFDRLIGLLNEWFVFDYLLPNGLSPLAEYLRDNPERLQASEIAALKEADASHFSTDFWLLGTDVDNDILVLEPFHEACEYEVYDPQASVEMSGLRGAIGLRLVRINDRWQPAGTGVYFVEADPTDELKSLVRESDEIGVMQFIDLVKENFGLDRNTAITSAGISELGPLEVSPELVEIEYEAICAQTGVDVKWDAVKDAIYQSGADDNPYELFKVLFSSGLPNRATFFALFDVLIKAWNVLPRKIKEDL
ncbi:MAG: hypothetical protein FWH40_03935 [Coriobacteriia bacterium]|nr:hypothetical protein [Coriobacteriia bacterium]MCL2136657.1 hypothetical protein [Coriobacteriia bacterium]